MLFSERCAGRGFAEWILFPVNRLSIAGTGSRIGCKNLLPASELIAFPLLLWLGRYAGTIKKAGSQAIWPPSWKGLDYQVNCGAT